LEMPFFEKRRFQQGATSAVDFTCLFPEDEAEYRSVFSEIYA